MILVQNNHKDAAFNLACEEYLMSLFDEDVFMMWQSAPSILIGRHQNAYREINLPYVQQAQIPVVRRMSGGGTVFCDEGNINFTFIENSMDHFADFRKFTKPVLNYLQSMGVPAVFGGRNDLVIEGMKFSGNAQYRKQSKVLHHGTLLIDSAISQLAKALTPRPEKFTDKAVNSVTSRVTNIKSHIHNETFKNLTVDQFKAGFYEYMELSTPDCKIYTIGEQDLMAINELVATKYATYEWNFGSAPKYSFEKVQKMPWGVIEVYFDVQGGTMHQVRLMGDYFSKENMMEYEALLEGQKHEMNSLNHFFEEHPIEHWISGANNQEMIQLFMGLS